MPVVLASEGPHGPVCHAASAAAWRRGIGIGARVVDVQAIHPDLHVEPADPGGDVAMLDRLAAWSRRWCPWTSRDGAQGIVLDVTGAAHLLGGEAALLRDVAERFAMQGLTARLALASNQAAAQALARHGPDRAIAGSDDVAAHLAPLPVRALGTDEETARLLDRLGLKTIGALMAVPRAALMRRFASAPVDDTPLIRLDRALGRLAAPLNAPPEPERRLVRTLLAEPVTDPTPHLPRMAERLCGALAEAGEGARLLRLTIYRVDGERRASDVATARATRDAGHILRLLKGRLDGIDPGFGFDLVTLEALRAEPLDMRQDALDGAAAEGDADVAALLDRLTARLGSGRITWSTWCESHLPERVEGRVPALGATPAEAPALSRPRPIRVLDRPEEVGVIYAVPEGPPIRFLWRHVTFDAVRHSGPERISPEWWRDRPGTRLRDYYVVEVRDGRRFWLYREGLMEDGRGGEPRWFLHGFFA